MTDEPPDYDGWPSVARWFFREITSLPSWKDARWAHAGDEYLRERRGCRDVRTIRRMRAMVLERGELARRRVHRGELLPNGERARRAHWIYEPGPAMVARQAQPMAQPLAPRAGHAIGSPGRFERSPRGRGGRSVRRHRTDFPAAPDKLSTDLLVDSQRSKSLTAETPGPRHANTSPTASSPQSPLEPTSLCSLPNPPNETAPSTQSSAHAIAHHYAQRTGRKWRTIDAEIVALLVPFLDQMVGDETHKVVRACAIVDQVVGECLAAQGRAPTLRFVFHPQIFWRRLERLDGGKDKPALPPPPPRRPVMVKARARALAPSAPPEPPAKAPPFDALQRLHGLGLLASERPKPVPSSSAPPLGSDDAALAALIEADAGLRARLGLPRRTAVGQCG